MTTPRDELRLILDSAPHHRWASERVNAADAAKVRDEWGGLRRAPARSNYARGLIALARRFPIPHAGAHSGTSSPFNRLGALVRSASSFPIDSESAQAFLDAGGHWLALQFHDPRTHTDNVVECSLHGWAGSWRRNGVRVFGWHRVEQTTMSYPSNSMMEGWLLNAEEAEEMTLMERQARAIRNQYMGWPLALVPLGRQELFPTGLVQELDMHLLPECFPEEGSSDDTVTSSVDFWVRSQVPRERIHPGVLFKDGLQRLPKAHAAEAVTARVRGMWSFVAENTPAAAWQVLATPK